MLLWFHYYSNHMDIMDKHVNSSDNTLTVKHGWDCGSNPVPDEHHKHRPRSIHYGLTRTQCTSVNRRSRIKCSDSMQRQMWVHVLTLAFHGKMNKSGKEMLAASSLMHDALGFTNWQPWQKWILRIGPLQILPPLSKHFLRALCRYIW